LIFLAAFFGAIVVPQLIAQGLNYLYPAQSRFGETDHRRGHCGRVAVAPGVLLLAAVAAMAARLSRA
jgi:hypothetical protein